jgi:hydroxypyruvate reductase
MGKGKGGRNQEFVLAALQAIQEQSLSGRNMPVILSAGTDGTDGPTDAAGAFIDSSVLVNVKQLSLSPQAYLDNNDAYHFFKQVNGLLITGPTQTNVMDIVVALIF